MKKMDSAKIYNSKTGMWRRKLEAEAVKFLWNRKWKHFEEIIWKRKQTQMHLIFWGARIGSIFRKTWGRDVEAVKFLWKRKQFEERSWKRKQTLKQLSLYGARIGNKNCTTASTSLQQKQQKK